MVSTMLWTALSLSAAAAHGAVVPRPQPGDFDLAGVILQSSIVQRHLTSTKSFMGKGFPYSEGPMEASKDALGPQLRDYWDHLEEAERKCLYVRNSFRKEGTQSFFDVVPNPDAPDTVTDEEVETGTISESTAIINTERLGWNKEESTESGGSLTAGVSGGISVFQVSLSGTIYGNQRTTGGKYGEASSQNEYTVSNTRPYSCPKKSICRHVTWTYTRTLRGKCFITPYYDAKCANSQHSKSKFSLALFGTCSPSTFISHSFYTYADLPAPGYGPDSQGIKMAHPAAFTQKFEEDCTFTYALRDTSGNPVRATANIIERESNPLVAQIKVTKVPKAVKWIKGPEGQKMCQLEEGWYWMPGNQFYIPPPDENTPKEWARRAELPDPMDREKNCPDNGEIMSKRADDGLPPPNTLGEVPANDLTEIVIVQDDMPAFIKELSQSKSEGFVANKVDEEAQPARRQNRRWYYLIGATFENCLKESFKENGEA